MNMRFNTIRLLDTASALALSTVALIGSSALQPAAAQTQGIYGGGSTLLSLTARQIFDCYNGSNLSGDGYTTTSPLVPGYLPTTCTSGGASSITGLYAGVGSGSGQRGFIANDPHQLLQSPTTTTPSFVFTTPAVPPVFVDGSNSAPFGIYPYPELDFAASDSPLPASSLTTSSFSGFSPSTSWQTVTSVTAPGSSFTTVTYDAADWGDAIQIPAAEVPVAIAINVSAPTTTSESWNIKSALSPNTQAGGAIQLSPSQLCAIFSGQVKDWADTSSFVVYLNSSGTQVGTDKFYYGNSGNASGSVTPTAYATYSVAPPSGYSALPITVVYRSDGSGTTFILTNYLAANCPLLDNGTNNYTKIFTGVGRTVGATANLPSTSFSTLIANILTVTGLNVTSPTYNPSGTVGATVYNPWIGVSGSGAVAAAINNTSTSAGHIGYLSNDFTAAYSNAANTAAPLSASILDEHLRAHGVYHPGDAGNLGSAQNFIAPTPANASAAWLGLTAPAATATYNDWNVYNQTFTSGTSGGLALTGKFILPFATGTSAYPLTGTTFLELYSCYNDPTGNRVPAITNFVSWLAAGSDASAWSPQGTPSTSTAAQPEYDPDVATVIRNNGFHELPASFGDAIIDEYIQDIGGNGTAITPAQTGGGGCPSGAIGAN